MLDLHKYKHKYSLLVLCVFFGFAPPAKSSDTEDILEEAYKNAILKVDVSSNTPVFKDDRNICKSEGTGFLIGSSYVVTAEHVYDLDPACGERNIVLKSKKHGIQRLAKIIDAKDDVAILQIDGVLPYEMCSLTLMSEDIFASKAIRYGIPGDFEYPSAMYVKIGSKDEGFSPLVMLTPTSAESGDSGGPVVYQFNVVGITRAKHKRYPAYSFMTVGGSIRYLVTKNKLSLEGRACNPAFSRMFKPNYVDVGARIEINDALNYKVRTDIQSILAKSLRKISSDIGRSDYITNVNPSLSENSNSVTIQSNSNVKILPSPDIITKPTGTVTGSATTDGNQQDFNLEQVRSKNDFVVRNAAEEATRSLEKDLWQKFVDEGTRAGKWKD